MPSWELFDRQPAEYREQVLPPQVRTRVAIEAGATLGWEHYVGLDGVVIGLDGFGASAPGPVLYEKVWHHGRECAASGQSVVKVRLRRFPQAHKVAVGCQHAGRCGRPRGPVSEFNVGPCDTRRGATDALMSSEENNDDETT